MKKHSNSQPAQPNQAAVTARKSTAAHSASNHEETIGAIMIMQSTPMGGVWKGKAAFDLRHRWHLYGGSIAWEPFAPANAQEWDERIHALADKANQKRQSGTFLRLSKTCQTRATWSLPAIEACPLRDETCEHCYALGGWYRSDLALQVDRVLRLEYLKGLLLEDKLEKWVDWVVSKLNALPPDEPFLLAPTAAFNHGSGVPYFRWHDSGDLFDAKYALAIFEVCEATPQVAHWLPTRMGRLVSSLVQKGAIIPQNLSIVVSVQRGGALEQVQLQAVREILKAQPHARIGLSYFVTGPARRQVDERMIEDQFGRGAVVCPALTAQEPKDRVCVGCRRCWASHSDAPIIYPKS